MKKYLLLLLILLFIANTCYADSQGTLQSIWDKVIQTWEKIHDWVVNTFKGKVPDKISDWWQNEKILIETEFEKEIKEMSDDIKRIIAKLF